MILRTDTPQKNVIQKQIVITDFAITAVMTGATKKEIAAKAVAGSSTISIMAARHHKVATTNIIKGSLSQPHISQAYIIINLALLLLRVHQKEKHYLISDDKIQKDRQ